MDQFAVHLMPQLLTLANDRVPNVRVLLAKTLRQTLLEKGGCEAVREAVPGQRRVDHPEGEVLYVHRHNLIGEGS